MRPLKIVLFFSLFLLFSLQGVAQATQCSGKTKTGTQCRNKTTNSNGYCYLHQDQAPSTPAKDAPKQTPSSSKAPAPTPSAPAPSKSGTYTGPRGGKYHYSKSGKKVYEKRK